ncbi:putative GMP synthase, partial [Daphnia magna]
VVKASLTFYDVSTNVHGRQTLSLCRAVNPEEKRRIIGDTFVKVADRTANDLNLTWDNLFLGQGTLRPDLIESASHMASSRAHAIKTHYNESEMVRRVVESLKGFTLSATEPVACIPAIDDVNVLSLTSTVASSFNDIVRCFYLSPT